MSAHVSLMLPCYRAAATLPMALASVVAQTHPDWECVCVDDGSDDTTWELLERARGVDARFRTERFARNRGRGAARQRCLELARGEYLAFLDSDDWLYPEKLSRQVAVLEAQPELALVSAGVLITDERDRAVGQLRGGARPGRELTVASFDRPEPPRFSFPPSLLRLDVARAAGFDVELRRSQDSDFLIRALLGRRYGVLHEILYAYSQGAAATRAKTIEGYRYRIRSHLRHGRRHPLRVARTVAETALKLALYQAAGERGARWLIERRWQPLERAEAGRFEAARAVVAGRRRELFGE
ncbi:MAG: glycosyltransferase family 2 protein [Polyangiaceae bacterium]|nr:glycosyltransferase family 2 protein [Polyangiaceae bacterium]